MYIIYLYLHEKREKEKKSELYFRNHCCLPQQPQGMEICDLFVQWIECYLVLNKRVQYLLIMGIKKWITGHAQPLLSSGYRNIITIALKGIKQQKFTFSWSWRLAVQGQSADMIKSCCELSPGLQMATFSLVLIWPFLGACSCSSASSSDLVRLTYQFYDLILSPKSPISNYSHTRC